MTNVTTRIWLAIGALVGVIFGSGLAPAQELWNHTRVGMTATEVQHVFPQAAKGERTWDGDDMELRVSALRAGGHDSIAYLNFTSEGLRTVELVLSPDQARGTIDTHTVTAQLSAKYGAPDWCHADPEECQWSGGGVDITLKAVRARSGDRVSILYRSAAPGAEFEDPAAATPIDVVRAFYHALAAGDGDQASQLVVPEKRARGPYSPVALTRFYSSLPQPIRLLAAYPHDGGSVFVKYRFEAKGGRICDGAADVRTAWVEDQPLIESIHSYSGC